MPCCYYSYVSCLQAWKFVVTNLVAKMQLFVCDNLMLEYVNISAVGILTRIALLKLTKSLYK